MAELDKKISQLEEKASLTGEEYVALADNTRNYKAKVKNIGGVIPSGGTADRPANPVVGTQYFDTDLGKVVTWDGSEWVESGGGTGAVVLHADLDSATEDDGVTTYRFTETQEEINAIIDKLGNAETATVIVLMTRGGEPIFAYSLPCVREESDGEVGYAGGIISFDIRTDVELTQSLRFAMVQLSSQMAAFMFQGGGGSIQDYLAASQRTYQKLFLYDIKTDAYLNEDGEYVEDEDYNVADLVSISSSISYPYGMCFIIKNNPVQSGMSVFADLRNKPVAYATTERANEQVCFSPFAKRASVHKDAEVYGFHSGVFGYFVEWFSTLNDRWGVLGIDGIDSGTVNSYSEGAIRGKYNNIHGEQVDKENDGYDSYCIWPLSLKAGDILTFESRPGTTTDMAALKDADGNIIPAVPLNADGTAQRLVYIASKDIDVELSALHIISYSKTNSFVFEYLLQLIGKTRDMMGINGTMQQLNPETAQEGKYYNLSGEVADNVGYNITAPVSLKEGDTLLVNSVSFPNLAVIKDADGNIVPARSTTQNTGIFYTYTATKNTTVEISYRNTGASKFYKFSSAVFEQLAKQIAANKGGDDGNLLLELPYLTGNFSTPTLGDGITDMPTLVAKIKAAKSVTLRNPSGSSVGCIYWNAHSNDTAVRLITVTDTLNQENVLRSNVQITYSASSGNFFVNIVPETVQTYALVKLLAYKQNTTGVDLGMSFDELKAAVKDDTKTILLANNDTETADERVAIAKLISDTGENVYITCAGADASAAEKVDAGNTFIRYNISQNTDDSSKCDIVVKKVFSATLDDTGKVPASQLPEMSGGNFEIVTALPETPDENKVYIIKGS